MDNCFVVLCCLCFHLALSHGSVGKFSIMPILSRFAGGVPVFLKLAYIYTHLWLNEVTLNKNLTYTDDSRKNKFNAMQYSIYLRIL